MRAAVLGDVEPDEGELVRGGSPEGAGGRTVAVGMVDGEVAEAWMCGGDDGGKTDGEADDEEGAEDEDREDAVVTNEIVEDEGEAGGCRDGDAEVERRLANGRTSGVGTARPITPRRRDSLLLLLLLLELPLPLLLRCFSPWPDLLGLELVEPSVPVPLSPRRVPPRRSPPPPPVEPAEGRRRPTAAAAAPAAATAPAALATAADPAL